MSRFTGHRSSARDKKSSSFRRLFGLHNEEVQAHEGLAPTRSGLLHHPRSTSVVMPEEPHSSPYLGRPDPKHTISAPTSIPTHENYGVQHAVSTAELCEPLHKAATTNLTAKVEPIVSNTINTADGHLEQEKVSLWDRAYDALKAKNDKKV